MSLGFEGHNCRTTTSVADHGEVQKESEPFLRTAGKGIMTRKAKEGLLEDIVEAIGPELRNVRKSRQPFEPFE